ncbi:MAG: hypothetical protein IIA03_12990 [Proteobacteria bacterium]|nr:hypothetical protein [Pseudomonadota bacterium]
MLINCVIYEEGRVVAESDLQGMAAALASRPGFLWVALRDPSDAELDQLQAALDLPALAMEDTRHGQQRPKLEEYGDTPFAALHMPELHWTWGYPMALVVIASVGGRLYWRFKRSGWL